MHRKIEVDGKTGTDRECFWEEAQRKKEGLIEIIEILVVFVAGSKYTAQHLSYLNFRKEEQNSARKKPVMKRVIETKWIS